MLFLNVATEELKMRYVMSLQDSCFIFRFSVSVISGYDKLATKSLYERESDTWQPAGLIS
jgi:hypothetical protein